MAYDKTDPRIIELEAESKRLREALEMINKEAVFFTLESHTDEIRIKTLEIISLMARQVLSDVQEKNDDSK